MVRKFLSFALILMLTVMFTACGTEKKSDKLKIVTSFYPIYLETINIAGNVEGVEVVNLTPPQETADIFVVNGLGMESFMDKVISARKDLKIIDASKTEDIYLLKDGDEINPHVWMSITYAMAQVREINRQLCELDPAHADKYKMNTLEYLNTLSELRDEMHLALDNLPNKDIITFHEAFAYFAAEFKFNVVGVIEREPGTEPTPQELTETIEKVNEMPVKVIFTEPQYSPKAADTIARETGAQIYTLDPIVTGDNNPDDYLNKMLINTTTLVKALIN